MSGAASPDSLGRLVRVPLREVWSSEAQSFTPWLARTENLKLLADAIGLELELDGSEVGVGPFRADILCRETAKDSKVLIENQLERTDHTHLGQLMTYAAGLSTVTIVWIAERFTDEHRAALDWLNGITSDEISLFGLEIELWRIGDSPIAPKFNVVSKPNDWVKGPPGGPEGPLSGAKALQLEFWRTFAEYVTAKGSFLRTTKPSPKHWMNLPIGRSHFHLSAIISSWDSEEESYDSGELRATVNVDDETKADYFFQRLMDDKEAIEKEVGQPLRWYRPEGVRARRIFLRRAAKLDAREQWPEYHEWLLKHLELLHKVFSGRIKKLPASADSLE